MAAKKKELLEQELIGAEDNGTVENGAAENGVTENAAAENEAAENEAAESEGVPNSADGPAAVAEEPGPGLDEILADMESGVSADTYSVPICRTLLRQKNRPLPGKGRQEKRKRPKIRKLPNAPPSQMARLKPLNAWMWTEKRRKRLLWKSQMKEPEIAGT